MEQSHGTNQYYIRAGAKGCIFTLRRRWTFTVPGPGGYTKSGDEYEGNLRTDDPEIALQKAREILGNPGAKIPFESGANGVQRGKAATHRINFGKYEGELMENIPAAYLVWALEQYEKRLGVKRSEYIRSLPTYQEEVDKREAEAKARQERQAKWDREKEEAKKLSQWVGAIGERITIEVEVLFSRDGENHFGRTAFVLLKDSAGNKFMSSGSGAANFSIWNAYEDWFSSCFDEDEIKLPVDQRPAKPRLTLTGTVKDHSERDGEKGTWLQRISIDQWEE